MCYNVSYLTQKALNYAKRRTDDQATIEELEKKIFDLQNRIPEVYHATGFAHPIFMGFLNTAPFEPTAMRWGLVPHWAKDGALATKMARQTLNARVETLFEKPAFREAASAQRCLIFLDGFFEHHHIGSKTQPYYIFHRQGKPLIVAGLYNEWADPNTGELHLTASIVTTAGNDLMAKIHNNPKLEGPRMPLLLNFENQDLWLAADTPEKMEPLITPYPEELLEAYPVNPILGKNAPGNVPQAREKIQNLFGN